VRTLWFLASGFCLLASTLILARLFSANFQSAPRVAMAAFAIVWLLATGFNMWVGVHKAGYAFTEELPVFLMLFTLPVASALLINWKAL